MTVDALARVALKEGPVRAVHTHGAHSLVHIAAGVDDLVDKILSADCVEIKRRAGDLLSDHTVHNVPCLCARVVEHVPEKQAWIPHVAFSI